MSLKGNPVKIGDGPAAVIGDESRIMSLVFLKNREGAVIRMIRKSEDLPELGAEISWTREWLNDPAG